MRARVCMYIVRAHRLSSKCNLFHSSLQIFESCRLERDHSERGRLQRSQERHMGQMRPAGAWQSCECEHVSANTVLVVYVPLVLDVVHPLSCGGIVGP
jgi:hypothetical protein